MQYFWFNGKLGWLSFTISFSLIQFIFPEGCGSNFRSVIYEHMLQNKSISTSCEIALRWKPCNIYNDKSTLFQEMDWCNQATNNYLSQCLPKFMVPYGATRPHWLPHRYEKIHACSWHLWYIVPMAFMLFFTTYQINIHILLMYHYDSTIRNIIW